MRRKVPARAVHHKRSIDVPWQVNPSDNFATREIHTLPRLHCVLVMRGAGTQQLWDTSPPTTGSGHLWDSLTDRQKCARSYCSSEHYLVDVLMGFPALIPIFCIREPKIDNLVA